MKRKSLNDIGENKICIYWDGKIDLLDIWHIFLFLCALFMLGVCIHFLLLLFNAY